MNLILMNDLARARFGFLRGLSVSQESYYSDD
jgi:hypothetical protein